MVNYYKPLILPNRKETSNEDAYMHNSTATAICYRNEHGTADI